MLIPDDLIVRVASDIPVQWNRYTVDNEYIKQFEGSTITIGIHCDDSQGNSLLIDDVDVAYTNDESVILSENFEHGNFPADGWTLSITNSTFTWEIGQNDAHPFSEISPSSHNSVVCNYDAANQQDEWLITRSFDLGNEPATLMFWAGYNSHWLSNATLKVYASSDNGVNWNQIYEPQSDGSNNWKWHYVNADLSDYSGSSNVKLAFQYVGLDGDVIVMDNIVVFTETTDTFENTNDFKDLWLEQNTPNPFNPSTKISYSLPDKGEVSLRIYNIKGQLVKELVNEVQNTGSHSVVWHGKDSAGRNCGSGVYFYRLIHDKKSEVRKMVLLK